MAFPLSVLIHITSYHLQDVRNIPSNTRTAMTNVNDTEQYMAPATRLRQLISQPGICVQAPGVYDGICARVAIESGFRVMVSTF